jgi:hypothetical protein
MSGRNAVVCIKIADIAVILFTSSLGKDMGSYPAE